MVSIASIVPEATQKPVVSVRNLSKRYGTVEAVKELNFDIYPGEIFGLIGPDGAGKTTTFHIMSGVMEKTDGEVLVLGGPPRESRLEIGYLTQQFSLYLDLSIEENIRYVAGLRDVSPSDYEERRDKYLDLMNLKRFSSRLAGQLSGGMKQKLALCCALIARPKLLLLDEPTTGVDPISRREFWDLLNSITNEGVTVAVATPYLDEAERCTRLMLLHDGEPQDIGTPSQLKERLNLHRLEVRTTPLEKLEDLLKMDTSDTFTGIQRFGDRLDILVADCQTAETRLGEVATDIGANDIRIERQEPTLENVFVNRLQAKVDKETKDDIPFEYTSRAADDGTAVQAENISKTFGAFKAVKGVSLTIGFGEIYGLLGSNGAGKTTTIKMLCGLLPPSGGSMALLGERGNLRSGGLRQRLGYMSQKFTLYDDLTIIENLDFYSGVYCIEDKLKEERINWVLETTDLLGQENLLTGKLPGGWKQRLSFGAAVMHQPELLFLDEPTSGVDPLARREMWKLIRALARRGTAVLVTTHFLEEAEHCNKLGFMVDGSMVAEGAPGYIKSSQPGQLVELRFAKTQEAYQACKEIFEPWRVSMFGDTVHLVLDNPERDLEKALRHCEANGLASLSQRVIPFSLEDAFIGMVQRSSQSAVAS